MNMKLLISKIMILESHCGVESNQNLDKPRKKVWPLLTDGSFHWKNQ